LLYGRGDLVCKISEEELSPKREMRYWPIKLRSSILIVFASGARSWDMSRREVDSAGRRAGQGIAWRLSVLRSWEWRICRNGVGGLFGVPSTKTVFQVERDDSLDWIKPGVTGNGQTRRGSDDGPSQLGPVATRCPILPYNMVAKSGNTAFLGKPNSEVEVSSS
jgi:hypothetical protein